MNFLSPPRSRRDGGVVCVNCDDEATGCLQIKVIHRIIGYIRHRQMKFHLVNLHHSVGCCWFCRQPPWAHEEASTFVDHKNGPISPLRTKHITHRQTYIERPPALPTSACTHDTAGWKRIHPNRAAVPPAEPRLGNGITADQEAWGWS